MNSEAKKTDSRVAFVQAVLLLIGIALVVLALVADRLVLGSTPGFGASQLLFAMVGFVMILSGFALRKRIEIILVCLSLFIVFLLGETGLRTYDAFEGFSFLSDHRNILAQPIKSVLPFRTFGVKLYKEVDGERYISSRHGELYPLDKPKGAFRIVCFGGSTTEQAALFHREYKDYPSMLQLFLRNRLAREDIEVINVGYSAYATPQSLILLELDVLSWNPDLVIISHNINDLDSAYWPHFTYDYSHKYSDKFFRVPDYQRRFTSLNILLQHSALYWFIERRLELVESSKSDKTFKQGSYGLRVNSVARAVFRRNLESFITVAKRNGVQVLLATQPLQPSEEFYIREYAHKPYNDIVIYPLHEEFVSHHSAFNNVIGEVARDEDVWFLDNNRLLGGKKGFFVDVVHYTKQGLEKLADNYANFIIAKKIVSH